MKHIGANAEALPDSVTAESPVPPEMSQVAWRFILVGWHC